MKKSELNIFKKNILNEILNQPTKKTGRTLVIGDIHGGFKALKQCIERAQITSKDKLIFLGDYVDGWSESAELIEYLIGLKETHENPPIFIRGNHDKWCENYLHYGQTPLNWLVQGGVSTVESYIRTEYLIKESHRNFFRDLVNYYIDDKNKSFVHGGFISRKGLGHEEYKADYYWDRTLWGLVLEQQNQKEPFGRFNNHKEIYIGHTSTCSHKIKPHYPEYNDSKQPKNGSIIVPMNRCNVWNLDTGGGWFGKLTIMDIDTKQYWQSDFVHTLYPEEKGRK